MATNYIGDPFYEEEEFQTFQQPQHFNLNDYPYRGPTQSGYVETGNIIGYPGEAGYDDNLSFERGFRGNQLADTGVQMAYKTPRTIADQNALKGLTEAAAAEELQANQLNQNYGQFFRNRPVNERNFMSPINEGIGSFKTNVGQKMGEGWDFVQQLPGMAMSALSRIPGIGGLMGMLPKTSPEQKAMMELYNSEDYQNLLNQIPGMANYNPVYGMGSGYGLTNAINKRLATLAKTRKKQGDDFSATLRKREEDLKKLLDLEKAKKIGGKTTTYTPTGNYGKKQGTTGSWTPGGSYQGAKSSPKGYSARSHSGGNYGGQHHWARGGRVGYANGGLASLFTRRG